MKVPSKGIIHWPVGCGDSTTIVVSAEVFMQVDLNHMAKADDDDCGAVPVVDELIAILPRRNKRPYLQAFVLTHPDLDHCRGFEDLLARVDIGELWFTPRIFSEYKKDLCEDAQIFAAEALRRVKETIKHQEKTPEGDRVRIVGFDDVLNDPEYKGFPRSRLSIPGHEVTVIDGLDYKGQFRAYIHAPFKEDADGERNDTSLAFQVTLTDGDKKGRALLLGDLCYPVLTRIFDRTKEPENLRWNALLAPHHCSKSVMFWKDGGDAEEKFRADMMKKFELHQETTGYIISSSPPIPTKNQAGDNPPHVIAKNAYEEIVNTSFLCTHEHCGEDSGEAIVLELSKDGFTYSRTEVPVKRVSGISKAVAAARGSNEPPKERVGFG